MSNWTLSLPIGDLNFVNTYHVTAQAANSSAISATTMSSFTYTTAGPIPPPVPSATTHYTGSGMLLDQRRDRQLDRFGHSGFGDIHRLLLLLYDNSSCTSADGTS